MIRIKLFDGSDIPSLQANVNDWLADNIKTIVVQNIQITSNDVYRRTIMITYVTSL